jgi:predicted RecA/RadA family phage recombinase
MAVKARFYSDGDVIDYTPSSAGTAGDIVSYGSLAGMLVTTLAASEAGALRVKGIIDVNKDSGTFAVGDPIYWDNDGTDVGAATGGAATKTQASGDFALGRCLVAAGGAATVAKVALNAPPIALLTNSSTGTIATSLVQITGGGTNYSLIDNNFASIYSALKKAGIVV